MVETWTFTVDVDCSCGATPTQCSGFTENVTLRLMSPSGRTGTKVSFIFCGMSRTMRIALPYGGKSQRSWCHHFRNCQLSHLSHIAPAPRLIFPHLPQDFCFLRSHLYVAFSRRAFCFVSRCIFTISCHE